MDGLLRSDHHGGVGDAVRAVEGVEVGNGTELLYGLTLLGIVEHGLVPTRYVVLERITVCLERKHNYCIHLFIVRFTPRPH